MLLNEIILKADINECKVENWQSNTGEYNIRKISVDICEELSNCDKQFVTFTMKDGPAYESLVENGKAEIPLFEKTGFWEIGLYAVVGDCEKRYSPHPAHVFVNVGSYQNGTDKSPIPTPGDYVRLLEEIESLRQEIENGGSDINVLTEVDVTETRGENDVYSANAINGALIEVGTMLEGQAEIINEVSALVGGAE